MCSMWSHYYRGSPSKCAQQENERESIGICNDESGLMSSLSSGTHPSAATQQASTGKAEYSERGPLSLREHGGETYSGQPEHRRSTLTPHQPRLAAGACSDGQNHPTQVAESRLYGKVHPSSDGRRNSAGGHLLPCTGEPGTRRPRKEVARSLPANLKKRKTG